MLHLLTVLRKLDQIVVRLGIGPQAGSVITIKQAALKIGDEPDRLNRLTGSVLYIYVYILVKNFCFLKKEEEEA